MRQSKYFFRTQKEYPRDETSLNARFLIRANFIDKLMAGVYSLLPLGLRVAEKIKKIIREEMNKLPSEELFMPALHPREIWEKTGRWQSMAEVMYQFKDHSRRDLGLGPTHEEIITAIAKKIIFSYKDLPLAVYQIQTKFRDEPRARSGLLRGREFTMKDLYSFHSDQNSLDEYYERAQKAYTAVFKRCGLKTWITEASGGYFSKYSHEFMVELPNGEDEIFLCRLCGFSRNQEIAKFKKDELCPKCRKGVLEKVKAIEVGNIFRLGTRFSEPVGLFYKDQKGKSQPVIMGCYGLGIERTMATIVEVHNDERGIVWPQAVAPFDVHLLLIGESKKTLRAFSEKVYQGLAKASLEVLYDDREGVSAGEKFTDADLIGIPWRLVVSEKTLLNRKVELKKRNEKKTELLTFEQIIKKILPAGRQEKA